MALFARRLGRLNTRIERFQGLLQRPSRLVSLLGDIFFKRRICRTVCRTFSKPFCKRLRCPWRALSRAGLRAVTVCEL